MIKNIGKAPFCLAMILAGALAGAAGMTGCGSREAEFLEKAAAEEDQEAASEKEEEPESETVTGLPAKIFVDVQGAVANPGVYELEEGSRVFQAVEAAGGCLEEAAESYVNQAKSLSDGQQIYVPAQSEIQEAEPGQDVIAAKAPEAAGTEKIREAPEDGAEVRVNLNTASLEQLTGLTGIGEAKARAIIAYRDSVGGFSSAEEIMNVEGIKEGTFSRIKDEIVVG